MQITSINVGDRIGVRHRGKVVTRTVKSTGRDYCVIEIGGTPRVVLHSEIASHMGRG